MTGYIRGGCSPIGMKRRFPTYIHDSCLRYDAIYVSAGVRGLQIRVAPARSGSIHGRRGRRHKPSDGGVAARVEPQAQSPFGRQKE